MQRASLFFPFAATTALTVEGLAKTPLVPGVSAIAEGPAKGHSYYDDATKQPVPVYVDAQTLATVKTACELYAGGVRVNCDHCSSITEAAGRLTAFRIDGPKLRADFELFRSYTGFAHLCELICTIPDTFGLSIDFDGEAEILDAKAYPRVTEIFSCDIVPSPAANEGGLFAYRRRPFDSRPVAAIHTIQFLTPPVIKLLA